MNVEVLCPATDIIVASKTIERLQSMTDILFNVVVSVDKDRRGSTWNINRLLRAIAESSATHIVIINEDIRVKTKHWLERMIEAMESDPRIGVVSPSGNCRTQPMCYGKPGMEPDVVFVSQLPLFCGLLRGKMVGELGLFDGRYYHYSDSAYYECAKRAGWKLAWCTDVWVENRLSPLQGEWKKHDQKLFRKEWW